MTPGKARSWRRGCQRRLPALNARRPVSRNGIRSRSAFRPRGSRARPSPSISPRIHTTWRCSCVTPSATEAAAQQRSRCSILSSRARACDRTGCYRTVQHCPNRLTSCAIGTTRTAVPRPSIPTSRPAVAAIHARCQGSDAPRRRTKKRHSPQLFAMRSKRRERKSVKVPNPRKAASMPMRRSFDHPTAPSCARRHSSR